jgi:hypothetical protein
MWILLPPPPYKCSPKPLTTFGREILIYGPTDIHTQSYFMIYMYVYIVTCMSVTIDGVWIGSWIYWVLTGNGSACHNIYIHIHIHQWMQHVTVPCSSFILLTFTFQCSFLQYFRHMVVLCHLRFKVPTAVLMKRAIFWDITPCSPFKVNRRFGGTCRLHLQVLRISQARNYREATCLIHTSRWFLTRLILWPWRWRRNVPQKPHLPFNELHDVLYQKTELFSFIYFIRVSLTCDLLLEIYTSHTRSTAKVKLKLETAP